MKLQVSQTVDAKNWDSMIGSIGGSIFHSSAWANYITRGHAHVVPQFIILLSNSGEVLGAALGFYECSQHKLFNRFGGRLWLDAIPVVRTDTDNESTPGESLRLLEAYACSSGVVELFLGSFASNAGAGELLNAGFELIKRLEFELELERSEDDLWSGLEYKRQKNIKKAMRLGVTVHDLPAKEGVSTLRRLQAESTQRIVARGGPDLPYQGQYEGDPVEVLVESGCGRIVGAKLNGTFVSAGLFTSFNGLVYHTLSGHSHQALETQAPTLLLWETIKRYQEEGCKFFNFGGCSIKAINRASPEHGVYIYKKAFGATVLECASGQKILRRTTKTIAEALKSTLGRYFHGAARVI